MMTEEGIIGCAFNSGSLEAQANLSVCDRGQQVLPRDFQASWCYRDSGSKTNKETYKTDMNIDLTKQTDSHFVFVSRICSIFWSLSELASIVCCLVRRALLMWAILEINVH